MDRNDLSSPVASNPTGGPVVSRGARWVLSLALVVAVAAIVGLGAAAPRQLDVSLGRQDTEFVAVYFDRGAAEATCTVADGAVTVQALLRAEGGVARSVRWDVAVTADSGTSEERSGVARLAPGSERRLRVSMTAPPAPYAVRVRLPDLDQEIDLRCDS